MARLSPGCRDFVGSTQKEVTDMAQGTVKWFNTGKGFGFILPDAGGNDVFLHISAVQRAGIDPIGEGLKVTFDIDTARDGRMVATNLALA